MSEPLDYEEMWNDLKDEVCGTLFATVLNGEEDYAYRDIVVYMYKQEGINLRDPHNHETTSAYVVSKLRELGELSND